ncbi:MAG TPA: hypothetical protein VIH93_01350 [Thermoanaerobaculia bacterium]
MHRAIPFAAIAMGAVAGALIAAAPARAEGSKVVQHTSLPIFGSVAETDSTEWISPQAKRSEATSRIQGGLIGTLAKVHRGNRERITITRLDKGVVWTLDPSSRTYTEVPIARYQDAAAEGRGGREAEPPREKSTLRVVDADFSVKVTGEEKTIAGFACKQSIMDGFIELEDTESKDRSRWELHDERWATPETAAIRHYHEVEREFTRNYMAKLGLSVPDARTADAMLQGLMRTTGISGVQLAKATAKLATESAKVKGFAIVNNFRWTLSAKAGSGEGKPAEGSDEPQRGGLASLLHRNRGGGGGSGSLSLEGTTEIRSLADETGDFEIPAGYTKVDKG